MAMCSRPNTPLAKLPEDDGEMRFSQTDFPSEWAESYRPGGFHPINIGDTFKNGRYRVIRKLGYGSFSTVWLAMDVLDSCYVALKVMDAKSSRRNDVELSILAWMKNHAFEDPGSKHILTHTDEFQHLGPNGTHACLISEAMGPTIASLVERLPQYEDRTFDTKLRYPKFMAKLILKHVLLGLRFLHENGIVHADLQPGNLLASIHDINSIPEEDLQQDQSSRDQDTTPQPLHRLDGAKDEWAPRCLFLGQSLLRYTPLDQGMLVKISDFGAAFWASDPPESTVTPVALRAPELIFGENIGPKIDIWSFGCLLYEILTGTSLFCVIKFSNNEDESADDDHLLQMNDILEPLPEIWVKEKWLRANKYFGPNRERLNPNVGKGLCEDPDHQDGLDGIHADPAEKQVERDDEPWIDPPLEMRFAEDKPDDIDAAEAGVVTSLLRSILRYAPLQRPSAAEILNHPWFNE